MTSKEFTMWLKGFMVAADQSEPSHANWVLVKEALSKVEDDVECKCGRKVYNYTLGTVSNHGITNTQAYSTTTTNDTSKQILND
jgi:hypothetical protein